MKARPPLWRGLQLTVLGSVLLGVAACGSPGATTSTAGTSSSSVSAAVLADLAPSGRLRVGMSALPPLFAVKDAASGDLHGIGVDLADALARELGVPVEVVSYPDLGALIGAASSGGWDVSIVPLNDRAKAAVDLTAPFLLVPHTFLVRADSSIHTMADADQPGRRIASVATAGHTSALTAQLKHATVVPVDTAAAGLQLLASGAVDAYADGRGALRALAAQVAGSRLIADDFFVGRWALAVAKGHATAQAFLARFIESMKADGAVQQAIDRLGKPDISVAPATAG